MRDIRIAAAQFEHRNADPAYNLSRIHALTSQAVEEGAEVACFHECSLHGYSFTQTFDREQMLDLAEPLDNSPSVRRLVEFSREFGIPIAAGLFERERDRIFNTYVFVTSEGVLARFRKLHAFVNPHLTSGDEYVVFEWSGCKFGILICYDNNLPENVRMTTLLGADIILMPHVTGCLPSVMPGRGTVDLELWHNRERDPARLRKELDGPKGRGWLMRWLPTRAYENGVYAVFTNPVGLDDGEVRNGHSMILDPFGEIIAECRNLGDDVVTSLCVPEKIEQSGGRRYIRARRPELYDKMTEPTGEPSTTEPGWDLKYK
ncbi:MAG: nitrilase [Planctomycetaceae bacterium]|nr:nitrilase [Planctomycetaceae bacterium]